LNCDKNSSLEITKNEFRINEKNIFNTDIDSELVTKSISSIKRILSFNDDKFKNDSIDVNLGDDYCSVASGLSENYIFKKKENNLITKNNSINNNDKIFKIAICAIAKNENNYIREWVEYYKNMGINKIILYDNNDLDGEKFDEVINDYIKYKFVEIHNRRGIVIENRHYGKSTQGKAYHDCYYNNYKKYDWIFFFDIDEFLSIDNKYNNIYDFLNDFNEYDGIKVQWRMYGDNGHLFYENKPVIERFLSNNNVGYDKRVKSILKCKNYKFDLIFGAHGISNKDPIIVNLNKKRLRSHKDKKAYDNLPVYLNHFYSKSTEEFIKRKFNQTDATFGSKRNRNLNEIKKKYFQFNNITRDKEKMFNFFINIK